MNLQFFRQIKTLPKPRLTNERSPHLLLGQMVVLLQPQHGLPHQLGGMALRDFKKGHGLHPQPHAQHAHHGAHALLPVAERQALPSRAIASLINADTLMPVIFDATPVKKIA